MGLSDRLFLPSSTDDAEHDEALSSRIAAVNLLDLGLGHLGVDVGESSKEVEAVISKCGNGECHRLSCWWCKLCGLTTGASANKAARRLASSVIELLIAFSADSSHAA